MSASWDQRGGLVQAATGDLIFDVRRGVYPNLSVLSIRGVNPDVDVTPEDVIPWGGDYVWQSSAVAHEVVSSSANDDGSPAGTGARTLRVEGLDNSFAEISEDVTLNGTTPVALVNNYRRINRGQILTCGSLLAAAGDIDVRVTAGAVIQARMQAGFSRTRGARYTIPVGKTAYIMRVVVDLQKSSADDVEVALRVRDLGAADQPFIAHGLISVNGGGTSTVELHPPDPPFDGPADIIARVMNASANNNPVLCTFDMILENA